MKNWLIASNIVLFVLVGVLFYMQYNSCSAPVVNKSSSAKVSTAGNDFKIAYFEMDSIENNFHMVKEMKAELNKKEESITNELTRLEKQFRAKGNEYQSRAESMTPAQGEMANKDMMQMQQHIQSRKQALDQEYQDFLMRKTRDIKNKIEEYLKGYNENNKFSYIVAYEPGLFYYRDTMYNITNDVLKGLNELKKTTKEKK
jgi:outer membrane protein